MPNNLLRQPNFPALIALVWLVVALALLLQHWGRTAETLLDADDAMRLVQMREWLAGQGWFDLHSARLQPPTGYDSHWSRLIDAGLGGMVLLFGLFDPSLAERLTRASWPLLWLLPTIAAMAAIAWRIAGREAATVALLLAVAGVPAYQQFTPGRIDHHNVQIALTLMIVAATVWSGQKPRLAALAGGLSGLALAIGFESVPYLVVCGVMLGLRHAFVPDDRHTLRDYGLALATSTALAFFVGVGLDRWGINRCDAIAVNNAAAAICAGLMLAIAGHLAHEERLTRLLAVIGAGSAAVAVGVLFEPRCAGGPFAMVDPAVSSIWRDQLRDLQPLGAVFRVNPLTAAAMVAFPALAAIAALQLAADRRHRSDFGFLAAALAFATAAALTVVAVRGYSYAIWLGMPLVAAMMLRFFAALKIERFVTKLLAGLMFTPLAISIGAITIAHANGMSDTDSFAQPASRPCFASASYQGLARLPEGLVIADPGLGPYVLALTPHSVMAAPYHRLGSGVVLAHGVLASAPDDARLILNAARSAGSLGNTAYIVVCGPRPPAGLAEIARDRSLWAGLRGGKPPAWLEPVAGVEPFSVYRVRL